VAPQNSPRYPHVTSAASSIIVNTLKSKYGAGNVVWPIVLIRDEKIIGYLYERNDRNTVNAERDRRPKSKAGRPSFFVDYTTTPRRVIPPASFLEPFIAPEYQSSYDYVTNSNSPYSTVDLDYVWWVQGSGWKGLELTTFSSKFYSRARAEELIRQLHKKRPTWQGPEGPRALRKIVEASDDLGIDLFFVCVNTVGKGVSNRYKTDGNVYWFPLTHDQIDRLVRGDLPVDANFDSFSAFLQWL